MNPEVKKLWTAALRSGEFKQGSNVLRSLDPETRSYRHCCLGVLCELHQRETSNGTWITGNYVTRHNESSSVKLTLTVAKWAGLDDVNPNLTDLTDGDKKYSASHWNDFNGATFDQIADMLDRSL